MERGKIDAEYAELMAVISELTEIIENERKLLDLIKTELLELRKLMAMIARRLSPRQKVMSQWKILFLMMVVLLPLLNQDL